MRRDLETKVKEYESLVVHLKWELREKLEWIDQLSQEQQTKIQA